MHEKYDANLAILEETKLNEDFFRSVARGDVAYDDLKATFTKGLAQLNEKASTSITPEQCIYFNKKQYEELDNARTQKQKDARASHYRNTSNTLVDRLHIRLAPNDKCRMPECNNRPSDIDCPTELGGSYDQDHTDVGVSAHGAKINDPSRIKNLRKKKEEKYSTLPTCGCCHDVFNPKNRKDKKPLSRKKRQLLYTPGKEHRTGQEVITSFAFMNFFVDLLLRGVLQGGPSITSRSLNAICWLHLNMPLTKLTTDPVWKWDEVSTGDLAVYRIHFINTILSNAALRLSEKCANTDCPKPDTVNIPTWHLGGGWHWEHDEGKDMGVTKLTIKHPIHLMNEIMRWCAATCSGCHKVKTRLNHLGYPGRVFDKNFLLSEQPTATLGEDSESVESSDSNSSSSDEDEKNDSKDLVDTSDEEEERPPARSHKTRSPKTHKTRKTKSDELSDDSSSSEDESTDEEGPLSKNQVRGERKTRKTKSVESSDDSSSSEDESTDEEGPSKNQVRGERKTRSSTIQSDESSDDSSSSLDEELTDEEEVLSPEKKGRDISFHGGTIYDSDASASYIEEDSPSDESESDS